MGELRLSEQTALKRIRVARTAREFPAIFAALADGRLNLNAVMLLKPHLTAGTADELLAAAANKTRSEIERILAERFPQPNVPAGIEAIPAAPTGQLTVRTAGTPEAQLSARTVESPAPPAKVAPLAPERYAVQFTIGQSGHDKLRHAQALLSHQIPSGNVAELVERALEALIVQLEKHKFAATGKPRPGRKRSSSGGRYVPADVKRRVRERDGDQCTFVSDTGQRCPARTRIEFDHVEEVARGGRTTVAGMRLQCRAHNQYGAECTFGAGFMNHKRQEAGRKAAEAGAAEVRAAAEARAAEARTAAEQAKENDVVPWLRQLGFRADEARRAAALCETIPDAPLEERVRVALSFFHPRARSHGLRRAAQNPGTAA